MPDKCKIGHRHLSFWDALSFRNDAFLFCFYICFFFERENDTFPEKILFDFSFSRYKRGFVDKKKDTINMVVVACRELIGGVK